MTIFDSIKTIVADVLKSHQMVEIRYGIVVESKPLQIKVHDKLILTEEFLDICEHLTRHERVVTLEHVKLTMRDCGDQEKMDYLDTDEIDSYEHHAIKMIMEDGLKKDEKVILARMQGGHKYIVLDRYYEGKKVWDYPKKQ